MKTNKTAQDQQDHLHFFLSYFFFFNL